MKRFRKKTKMLKRNQKKKKRKILVTLVILTKQLQVMLMVKQMKRKKMMTMMMKMASAILMISRKSRSQHLNRRQRIKTTMTTKMDSVISTIFKKMMQIVNPLPLNRNQYLGRRHLPLNLQRLQLLSVNLLQWLRTLLRSLNHPCSPFFQIACFLRTIYKDLFCRI